MKYKRGSNQFKKRERHNAMKYAYYYLFSVGYVFFLAFLGHNFIPARELISPIVEAKEVKTTPTPTPTEAPHPIKDKIREVFGRHADKAFKLLECENSTLNPQAVNTYGNTPAGSRDIGVFQINEYWQGVNAKFLLDPDLNVRIAWRIYTDSDYTFRMWTCGKRLGI